MATSRIEEVGTPSPHVAGRQFHARVGVVRDIIIVSEFDEASLGPRVLLALVGLGGASLRRLALFQLIPFFFERRVVLYHAQSLVDAPQPLQRRRETRGDLAPLSYEALPFIIISLRKSLRNHGRRLPAVVDGSLRLIDHEPAGRAVREDRIRFRTISSEALRI